MLLTADDKPTLIDYSATLNSSWLVGEKTLRSGDIRPSCPLEVLAIQCSDIHYWFAR